MITSSNSPFSKFLDLTGFLVKFLPETTLIIFCLLTRLIQFHLEDINSTIIHGQFICSKHLMQLNPLKQLKKRHLLIVKLVNRLNQYFGFYLTIAVAYSFIGVTNVSMFILTSAMKKDGLPALLMGAADLIDCFIKLYLITSSCDGISTRVTKFIIFTVVNSTF